ncbi:hypothetical protein CSUI_008153 [Cystoisospora suis]|uniref:Transmembrane protein n=1 Tax=Cystoisospora suis TaxID=483139 RepID=A0A2C6KNH6_9APIC|nr:hypothetical protein CSUI_008153 [Cystoisospora suis]
MQGLTTILGTLALCAGVAHAVSAGPAGRTMSRLARVGVPQLTAGGTPKGVIAGAKGPVEQGAALGVNLARAANEQFKTVLNQRIAPLADRAEEKEGTTDQIRLHRQVKNEVVRIPSGRVQQLMAERRKQVEAKEMAARAAGKASSEFRDLASGGTGGFGILQKLRQQKLARLAQKQ